jgi:hypothetical protein
MIRVMKINKDKPFAKVKLIQTVKKTSGTQKVIKFHKAFRVC